MAQRKTAAVHAFKRIREDLENDRLRNVLLFYGRENYLVRWSIDRVKERYVNQAVEMFDFTELDGTQAGMGDIRAACETMPMMSEKRVVVVRDFEPAGEDADEFIEYLKTFPDFTVLLLVSGTQDKRRKLFKSIQKHGAEYDFDSLDQSQLKSFIVKRLRSTGTDFEQDVPGAIMDLSGYYDKDSDYTIDNIINDIAKIISHSSGKVSVQDVEETIAGNQARDVFRFSEALAAGRKGEALALLSVLLSYGENEFKLLGLVCAQFETMLLINEMLGDGMTASQMHDETGIHEFRIKKTLPLARQYSTSRLRGILMKAYEVDRNIKSGTVESKMALELFVATV